MTAGEQRLALPVDPPGTDPPGTDPCAGTRRLLGFRVGVGHYALPLTDVREILRLQPVTEVPLAPVCVLGVIAAHGVVTTLVDLRRRLGEGGPEPDSQARILLVSTPAEDFGLLVDEVSRIHRVTAGQFESAAAMVGGYGAHVAGIARPGGTGAAPDLLVVLDLGAVLQDLCGGGR